MAEVEIVISDILKASAQVSGLVSDRIYPNNLPEEVVKPTIVYIRESMEAVSVFGSDSRLASHDFSILSLGRTYREARSVHSAVDTTLRRNMTQGFDDVFLQDVTDRYHAETNTYCVEATYRIWASNTPPRLINDEALVCILRVWIPHILDSGLFPYFEDLDGDPMTFTVSVSGTGAEARIRQVTDFHVLDTRGLVKNAAADIIVKVDDGKGGILDVTFPVTAEATTSSFSWLARPAVVGSTQITIYTTAVDGDQIPITRLSTFTITGDTTTYTPTGSVFTAAVTEGFGATIDFTPALNMAIVSPSSITFTN